MVQSYLKGLGVLIPIPGDTLEGTLSIPLNAKAIVLFVHGSGSSRLSPRNQLVAKILNEAGLATLLFDLLTREEEKIDTITAEFRFDIELLTHRLINASDWVLKNNEIKNLNI